MFEAIDVAAGFKRIAEIESGCALGRSAVSKLMYYAQGLKLAESGELLFSGVFKARTHGPEEPEIRAFIDQHGATWAAELAKNRLELDDHALRLLRDVWHVFGRLTDCALSEATRAEAPWLRARVGLAWDQDCPKCVIENAWVHHFFADVIETGEDLMVDLGITTEPDAPSWRLPFELGVNLKRLAGHPLFDDRLSRQLRTKIGYAEFPEDWTNIDLGEFGIGLTQLRAAAQN